jgi:hypothetical protein
MYTYHVSTSPFSLSLFDNYGASSLRFTRYQVQNMEWIGSRSNPYVKPGQCQCGQLMCVACHDPLTSTEASSKHHCNAVTLSKGYGIMDEEMLIMLHDAGIRKVSFFTIFITVTFLFESSLQNKCFIRIPE